MPSSCVLPPLEFSRVSSGYGMRFHPVLGRQRPHLGVDYAAPTGTPVRTVADGVIEADEATILSAVGAFAGLLRAHATATRQLNAQLVAEHLAEGSPHPVSAAAHVPGHQQDEEGDEESHGLALGQCTDEQSDRD